MATPEIAAPVIAEPRVVDIATALIAADLNGMPVLSNLLKPPLLHSDISVPDVAPPVVGTPEADLVEGVSTSETHYYGGPCCRRDGRTCRRRAHCCNGTSGDRDT